MNRAAWKCASGLSLAAAVALSGVAFAEPAATTPTTAAPEATVVAPATEAAATAAAPVSDVTAPEPDVPELSGMIVAIGKDGKLRQPTREEAVALLAQRMPALGRMAPTRFERLPNGMTSAVLGPEYMNYSMVTLSPSGTLDEVCTNDPVIVLQILDGATPVEK